VSKIVLCVDDSQTMQMVAEITFRGTEYTYVGARSADEALTKAKAQKPALVLADAQMPGKTGYDLCLSLKSDGATGDVPVVILCGNAAAFDASRGAQVGADGTLPKPWDTQTMLEKVIEIVGKAGAGVAKPGGAVAAAPAPVAPVASAPVVVPVAAASGTGPTAAAAAAAKAQPPRSATIMGMPTIKMPAGSGGAPVAPMGAPTTPGIAPVAVAPAAPAPAATPSRTTVMAVPPMANTPTMRPPAAVAAPVAAPAAIAAPAAVAAPAAAVGRPPMVAGTPTKRSALVERTLAKMAARLAEAAGLEPGSPELLALLKLSTEIVERVVWEVVPELAEQIIRENLAELAARRS
jgi:CheY-like chemotaxis protein